MSISDWILDGCVRKRIDFLFLIWSFDFDVCEMCTYISGSFSGFSVLWKVYMDV